ncbi:MAG: XRE family transcriptional regulator [Bacteroidota bacterium]
MIYFASNIKLLRKRRKRTQEDVSFTTGIKRPTLSGYENSGVLPSVENLLVLSDYFGVSADTLLRVDLGTLSDYQLSQLERGSDVFIRGSNIRVLATTVDNQNRENIEMVNEKAKAGYTTGFADPEYIRELPRFQLPFLSANKKYRSFQVHGDSMLPVPEGAWITGEFVQDWNQIVSSKPYIILTVNDGIVFKIVQNQIAEKGVLRLYSLNTAYEPYDLNLSDVREIWRFKNFISEDIPGEGFTHQSLSRTMLEIKKDVKQIKSHIQKGRSLP